MNPAGLSARAVRFREWLDARRVSRNCQQRENSLPPQLHSSSEQDSGYSNQRTPSPQTTLSRQPHPKVNFSLDRSAVPRLLSTPPPSEKASWTKRKPLKSVNTLPNAHIVVRSSKEPHRNHTLRHASIRVSQSSSLHIPACWSPLAERQVRPCRRRMVTNDSTV
jgi:hypothetical protein